MRRSKFIHMAPGFVHDLSVNRCSETSVPRSRHRRTHQPMAPWPSTIEITGKSPDFHTGKMTESRHPGPGIFRSRVTDIFSDGAQTATTGNRCKIRPHHADMLFKTVTLGAFFLLKKSFAVGSAGDEKKRKDQQQREEEFFNPYRQCALQALHTIPPSEKEIG